WGSGTDGDPSQTVEQRDTIDAGTFVVSSEMVKNPFGQQPANPLDPSILKWPNLDEGGLFDFASGSNIFDQSATRAALLAAVQSVDLAQIWTGVQIDVTNPFPGTSGPYVSGWGYNRFGTDAGI